MPLSKGLVIEEMTTQKEKCVKLSGLLLVILILAGCAGRPVKQAEWNPVVPVNGALNWSLISEQEGAEWGIDPQLITAIIAVESAGNPSVVSASDAVGLMQIKASTAGREVYRMKGLKGEPSRQTLRDPANNIRIGTAYLSILEKGILRGIANPQVMQYALVVSYANGAGALLRTFDGNRDIAIAKINRLDPAEFYQHIVKYHPAPQAARYLYKINRALGAM